MMNFMATNIFWFGVLALWYLASLRVDPIILPSPEKIIYVFYNSILTIHGGVIIIKTIGKFIFSYFFAIGLGVFIGIVSFQYKKIGKILLKTTTVIQGTPVITWILLCLLWFPSEVTPIFILTGFVYPILARTTYSGLVNTDPKLLEMGKIYEISKKDILFKIQLPNSIKYIRSGIKITINSGFKILVTAEVIGHLPNSLGSMINLGWLNIETETIVGWTLVILVVTFVLEKLVLTIFDKIFRRYLND